MVLKKGSFSDFEIVEIYQQINGEEYQQDTTTRILTVSTEKQEPPTRSERQNIENWSASRLNTPERTWIQEDKINIELIKTIITEKRPHYHLAGTKKGKNQVENEMINKLIIDIPTGSITELNKLIFA